MSVSNEVLSNQVTNIAQDQWKHCTADLLKQIFLKLDPTSLARCRRVCSIWKNILNSDFFLLALKVMNYFFIGEKIILGKKWTINGKDFYPDPMPSFFKTFRYVCRTAENLSIEKIVWLQTTSAGKEKINAQWEQVRAIVSKKQVGGFDVFGDLTSDELKTFIPLFENSLFMGKWSYLNTTPMSPEDKKIFYLMCSQKVEIVNTFLKFIKQFVPLKDPIWKEARVTETAVKVLGLKESQAKRAKYNP